MPLGFVLFLIGLFLELHASYVDFLGFAPSNYFFLASLACVWKPLLDLIYQSKKIRAYLLIVAVGAFCILIADQLNQTPTHWRLLLKTFTKFPIIFLLTIFFCHKEGFEKVAKSYLFLMIPSLVVGLGQLLKIPFFWEARRWIESTSFDIDHNPFRITGLAQYFVEFGLKAYVALFCLLLWRKLKTPWLEFFGFLIFFTILGTLTRSFVYGALLALSAIVLTTWKLPQQYLVRRICVLCFCALALFQIYIRWSMQDSSVASGQPLAMSADVARLTSTDIGTGARVYMLLAAAKVLQQNFVFGMGSNSVYYSDHVAKIELKEIPGIAGIEQVPSHHSHNSFVNFALMYGTLTFALLMSFLALVLWSLNRQNDLSGKILAFGLIGLLINGLFHNSSLWDSSIGIFFLALAVAYTVQDNVLIKQKSNVGVQ